MSVPSATMEYYKRKMLCAPDIETLLKYRDEVMEFFCEGSPNSEDPNNMRGSILPRKLLTYFEQQEKWFMGYSIKK